MAQTERPKLCANPHQMQLALVSADLVCNASRAWTMDNPSTALSALLVPYNVTQRQPFGCWGCSVYIYIYMHTHVYTDMYICHNLHCPYVHPCIEFGLGTHTHTHKNLCIRGCFRIRDAPFVRMCRAVQILSNTALGRHLLQIAPMMEVTYKDFRYFMRLLSRRAPRTGKQESNRTCCHARQAWPYRLDFRSQSSLSVQSSSGRLLYS